MTTRTWLAILGVFASIAAAKDGPFRDPKQVIEIIEKSKLSYSIAADSSAFFDLRAVEKSPIVFADPDWIAVKDPKGKADLKKQVPSGCAIKEDSLALAAYSAKDFKSAVAGYRRAYACDGSYVKALTYLGNSFFGMDKLDSAKFWFHKAIAANPDDYQAHFFLSDAYLAQGKTDSAYSEFVEAYLRNPNSKILRDFAKVLFQQSGKVMDNSWPVFGFSLSPTKDGIKIALSDMRHLPIATCMAAWNIDPEFESSRKSDDAIQQTQYKNCLANQAVHTMSSKPSDKPVDRISQKLVRVVDGKLLGPMVVWERLARSRPESIYLLAPEDKAKIHDYVAQALEIR